MDMENSREVDCLKSRGSAVAQNGFGVTKILYDELQKSLGAGLEHLSCCAPWGGLAVGGGAHEVASDKN